MNRVTFSYSPDHEPQDLIHVGFLAGRIEELAQSGRRSKGFRAKLGALQRELRDYCAPLGITVRFGVTFSP